MKYKYNKKNKGFTLVELMASVGIFLVITTLVIVRHSQFSSTLLIENLAYDIALSVRKAQVFGLSVREVVTGSGEFNVGYGVHFDSEISDSYIFFADRNRNKKYDDSSEIIETFGLKGGNSISKFCGMLTNGSEKCSSGAGSGSIKFIDIIFERPNPDAIIKSNVIGQAYTSAKITITSQQEKQWNINVVSTGQISVQK